MKEYAYFPGCAAEASTREADKATREVLRRLGIPLHPTEEFTCCGAGCLAEEHPRFNLALNARNIAVAEASERDLLTLCNTCLLHLRKSQKELEDLPLREEINAELGKWNLRYQGKAKVIHLLHLFQELGWETIRSQVKRPLRGLKVAPFYGCQIVRPHYILGPESIQEPTILEELIEATGATALAYRERLSCCGFHILLIDEKSSLAMASRCLDQAQEAGADLLVTPCTLCHISLDMYQEKAGKSVGKRYQLPVLHLAQLIGLALGIHPRKLHLQNHLVNTRPLLWGAREEQALSANGQKRFPC
ncbi:MAG: CoB--CoM heterodisulfide reductase iron-sulfur subunit B family protein [candidate division NC10 bacterium]|nr:CoB--CoM heterodisulfide reductase iron-sulfur subunit B family protein [candidate division NC10 bacterium]